MSATEIITKDDVFEYFKRFPADGNRDDLIRLGINSFLENYCSRVFAKSDGLVENFSVHEVNSFRYLVKRPPIRSIISVSSGRTTPVSVDSLSYAVEDGDIGLIVFSSELTTGLHQYSINYNGGFETIPNDLRLVALSIAMRESEKAEKNRHGMKTRIFTQGTFEMTEKDLEPFEIRILRAYQLMRY